MNVSLKSFVFIGKPQTTFVKIFMCEADTGTDLSSTVQDGSIWFGLVQSGSGWFDLVRDGSIWVGLVRSGSRWFDLVRDASV
jgi:hypothetical protein